MEQDRLSAILWGITIETHRKLNQSLSLWVELFVDFIVFANKRRFYPFSCNFYSFGRFEN